MTIHDVKVPVLMVGLHHSIYGRIGSVNME